MPYFLENSPLTEGVATIHPSLYSDFLIISGLLLIIMSLYIWQFKDSEYITYFTMLLFSLAIYSIFYALEISSTTLETSLIFYKFQYVGIVMIPAFLLLFSMSYTREKQWITPARIAVIFIVPTITLILVFTSEMHQLFHEVTYINTVGPLFGLYFEPGIYYWFSQLYSIILILFSIALFFKMWLYNRSFFGMHLIILITCSLIPFSVYLLYLAGFFPDGFDPIPFAFILSVILAYIGIFRYKLLDITPLARSFLFENIPSGVIVLDGKERVVDINKFAEKYLDLSAKDIGKPVSEVLGYWSEVLDLECNDKEINRTELKKSLADGTFWFAVNVSPLYDEHDDIHGKMIVLDNITDRKLTEEILSIQHDLSIDMGTRSDFISTLNSLMEHLVKIEAIDSGGIYLVDDNGNLDLIVHNGLSQEFIEQCSHYDHNSSNAKIVRDGRPVYKKYSDISPDVSNNSMYKEFLSEGLKAMTAIPIHFEGDPIACMSLSSHTYNEIPEQTRNGLESIASFAGEYVARAKMQDILNRQKADLENLFNSMDDLFFVLDESGNIISTNESARLKLGYNEEEFTSMKAIDVHPEKSKDKVISIVNELLGGKIDSCSGPLLSKDGAYIPVETRVTAGKWNGKKVLFGISRDVSERQKFEKEIIEAKNKAEEANRIKSEFLANMSHELRTPLNSIIGFSQLLNTNPFGNLTEKEIKYSDNIMTSGKHLLDLINDILDISKIESGEMELEIEKFSSSSFFSEVEDIIKHLADRKNIEISNLARSESIEMYADRLRMTQILYNLLSNSLKFTPENGCI
ncbi:histidine kinase N-terminal 7TM domain-containing protein [Methanococcoides sp. NM1]|uniref:histidine kinase N-terminal 7TM domain-containing protein n=1 Tax=Methanococcoides sp. NM1 TaxID=1201013 RepID=UPI001082FE61|nr:histidine kinase N-terminal 7TM domain-containing protein [Methanococcoides sp. NM1]